MADSNGKSNIFVRIVVIIGMILILFFIALAIVKYVPKLISAVSPANVSLTSLFNSGTASSTTQSTNNTQTDNGYDQNNPQNQNGASYATSTNQNNSQNNQNNNYSTSTPTNTNTNNTSSNPPKKSTGGGYTYTYRTYTGPADLSVSLVKVGQIMADGSFVQTTSIQPGARVQVQFIVSNVGSGRSGGWNLQASLPTSIQNERSYISSAQPALNPGDRYQMTLAFDAYDGSQSAITISIIGGDVNSGNNTLTIPLSSNGNYNNTNNNGCYYNNGTYYCNNNNSNNNNSNGNGCYYLNGSYVCSNNTNNNGSASDLSVRIISVGTMDRNSGQFYYTNNFNRSDKVAIQFEVKNEGGQTSSNWTFNASLPSSQTGTYYSNSQQSLSPGQTITFTVGFDNPNGGTQNASVQLTPQGSDSNSSNNFASKSIYVN